MKEKTLERVKFEYVYYLQNVSLHMRQGGMVYKCLIQSLWGFLIIQIKLPCKMYIKLTNEYIYCLLQNSTKNHQIFP